MKIVRSVGICLAIFLVGMLRPAQAQSPSSIPGLLRVDTVVATSDDSFLKQFSYPVDTQAASGSCVLIGRKNGAYYALTAAHVVSGPAVEGGISVVVNKIPYKAKVVSSFAASGLDLALISFQHSGFLPLAILFPNLQAALAEEGSYSLRGWRQVGSDRSVATVVGYSTASDAVTEPMYRKVVVSLQDRIDANKDGYEFAYEAATFPGMSGGGVFAWLVNTGDFLKEAQAGQAPMYRPSFPVLIGVHGRSEGYAAGGRSGLSLGVPVDLIAKALKGVSLDYGIPSSIKAILAEFDSYKGYCWKKHDFIDGKWVCS